MYTTMDPSSWSALATGGGASSPEIITTVTLIVLLIMRELLGSLESPWARRLTHVLPVGIVPLLIVFAATVAARIAAML